MEMMDKVLVKAYIPRSLEVALKREVADCGCSMSNVIQQAIRERVHWMAKERRQRETVLSGQLELKEETS
jgi:heterodisulfide reductase subunit A-like polyferredoxin